MNPVQTHLALNHLPLFLILAGIPVLFVALRRKSAELKGLASIFFIVAGVVTVPVFLTGEPTENIVVHKAGVARADIEEHEMAADFALYFGVGLGVFVLALSLFEKFKRPAPVAAWWFVVALGVFTLTVFLRTGYLGGHIRHDEIKTAAEKAL